MRTTVDDFRKIIQIAAPLVAAFVALSASHATSRAQTNHMLVVPASDGYGFDDCLGSAKACGQVIADAWCEAHGMAAAVSFGHADDITASIGAPGAQKTGVKAPRIEPGAFVVNCRD